MGKARLVFALMEFALPLAASVLFLKLITNVLDGNYAGLIVLLNTASLLLVNMEPMGGRAYSGYISTLVHGNSVKKLLFTGLIISVLVGFLELLLVFSLLFHYFFLELSSFKFAYYVFLGFGLISFLGIVNAYFSTIRLGLGDSTRRSQILILGHLASLFFLLIVFCFNFSSPVVLLIPFFVRELFVFLMNLAWLKKSDCFEFNFSGDALKPYWHIAIKSSFLSISVAFFEPILKILVADTQGLAHVPAFELFLRLVAAARNAITVFLQNFIKILSTSDSSVENIYLINRLFLPILICCMSGSVLGVAYFGNMIVPGASSDVVFIYIKLMPAIALYLFGQLFYFKLMFSGHVGKLLWLHVGMGLFALSSFILKDTWIDYLNIVGAAYLIGGLGALVFWGIVYGRMKIEVIILIILVSFAFVSFFPYFVSLYQVAMNLFYVNMVAGLFLLFSLFFIFRRVEEGNFSVDRN